MFKLFKNAFRLTNEGILLAIPLILFLWLMTIYLTFAGSVVDTLPEALSALVTLLCMVGAFFAGWFYIVKKTLKIAKTEYVMDEDRAKALLSLMKQIPAGIGKYFVTFLGMSLFALLIFALYGALVYKFGLHFIGSIDFTPAQIKGAMASPQDMKAFLDSLTPEQIYALGSWNLLFMAATSLLSFLLMLWIPEIIYQTQNPVIALFKSLKKLFVKFPKALLLFVYITFLNIVISFANTFAVLHPIIYMILMTIYFYFLVYVVVLIFYYYDTEFNDVEE
ncbi:hypothetical protein IAC76_06250 [Spirochaetes bacterium]|uniref:Uncharacterized protein n=1 Tax=Candidatus Scatousia excrementipullorum TaxID=2840936 RepID=A0A9D9H157_9BACT|nr:hypothetical protein [Candidatus Scatousia excrementipullorum]